MENLHMYITTEPTKHPHKFILNVLLVRKALYTIKELAPMPVKDKDGKLFIIANMEKYIGLSEDDFFTTNVVPNDCIPLPNMNICKATLKLEDIKTKNHCSKIIIVF